MEVRQREVEEEIAQLEEQMETLSQRISQAGEAQDVEQVQALGVEYSDLETTSQDLWNEWEVLSGTLEDDASFA
jgi:chromosome segregation ATPase